MTIALKREMQVTCNPAMSNEGDLFEEMPELRMTIRPYAVGEQSQLRRRTPTALFMAVPKTGEPDFTPLGEFNTNRAWRYATLGDSSSSYFTGTTAGGFHSPLMASILGQ